MEAARAAGESGEVVSILQILCEHDVAEIEQCSECGG